LARSHAPARAARRLVELYLSDEVLDDVDDWAWTDQDAGSGLAPAPIRQRFTVPHTVRGSDPRHEPGEGFAPTSRHSAAQPQIPAPRRHNTGARELPLRIPHISIDDSREN